MYECRLTLFLILLLSKYLHENNSFSPFPPQISAFSSSKKETSNKVALKQSKFNDSFARGRQHYDNDGYGDGDDQIREDQYTLREEIAWYQHKLATLHNKYSKLESEYEYFSEAGYLNKCAQIDNALRYNNNPSSSNTDIPTTIKALQHFLPAYNTMQTLQQKYKHNDFCKNSYFAISLNNAFQQLNVMEYTINPGERFDKKQMNVSLQEYSNVFDKDCVICMERCGLGMKLLNNDVYVLQRAECVVSLGPQQKRRSLGQEEVKNAFGRRFSQDD